MGFRPVDDSDLEPRGRRNESSSSKARTRQAAVEGEYNSKRKKKRKKKKQKTGVLGYVWTFIKVFGTTVGAFILILGILIFCSMFGLFGNGGNISFQDLNIGANSEIYFVDPETGEEEYVAMVSDGDGKRKWVDIEDIPKDIQDAFVAIEDERFYEHSGFDFLRTTKATIMYVWGKITGGGSDFGGSTITQQFIKNATGNWENSPTRKIKEISQAVNLEKQLTKDEVLELYLNIINLSNNCYGVQAASMEFFGKPVNELNLAECACIAGITQNPSKYDPIRNPKNNKAKQEIVLRKMLELGYIDEKEHKEAVEFKLKFKSQTTDNSKVRVNEYFVEHIVESITDEFVAMGYSRELAIRKAMLGGLKIITTVDPKVQAAINEVYSNPETCAQIFGYKPDTENTPQSAIVILAPDGGIRGLYGGLGVKSGNLILDRTTVPRQPGSSIKPISVYAPALEAGIINAATVYDDAPVDFNGWSPKNSYSDSGSKTVQVAVQRSSNRIAAQVLRDLGVDESFEHLRDNLSITSLSDNDRNLPSLSLGGMFKGISPLEMTAAYAPFINGGVYTKPYIYTKVYDKSGSVILEHRVRDNQALSPQTAYIMTQLLRRVVTSGTGTLANLPSGVFAAGKTGTTDDNKDKWFVGFTPNYVCGIWHGYDKNQVVGSHTTGSQIAFSRIMNKIHASTSLSSISAPSGITMLSVCSQSGCLATESCTAISLPFTSDNKPDEYCWHEEEILVDDNGNVIVDLDAEEEIIDTQEPAA